MALGRRRAAALLAGGLLSVLALLCGRMLLGARAELAQADAARGRGDDAARVRHLRRAMASYLPGSPFVRQAHLALLGEARRAEAMGAPGRALEILHELRSAILALRGLTHPFEASLPEINRAIARLSAGEPEAAAALRGPSGAEALLRRLERPPEPDRLWAGLGLCGFLGYGGGGLLLFLHGLRPDASRVRRRFWPLLALVLVGLFLFGLGMGLA